MNQIDTSQLVELQNGEVTTTSLQVAEFFSKEHRHVLRAIDQIRKDLGLPKIGQTQNHSKNDEMFFESKYVHSQNHQEYRMVILNRKGFMMVAAGFTGKLANTLKSDYFDMFDAMENYIKEQEQHSFFIPETVDQQLTREKLAISKQRSVNEQSREVRAWTKLTENSKEIAKAIAPRMLSQLLDVPEIDLLETK